MRLRDSYFEQTITFYTFFYSNPYSNVWVKCIGLSYILLRPSWIYMHILYGFEERESWETLTSASFDIDVIVFYFASLYFRIQLQPANAMVFYLKIIFFSKLFHLAYGIETPDKVRRGENIELLIFRNNYESVTNK